MGSSYSFSGGTAGGGGAVDSVAGRTGDVVLTKTDVGLASVDNTADTAKPVSTAQQTALNLKANLASPTLTGTPAAPTASAATNTTQIATTAFVQAAVTALIAAAPGALDTLDELAAALGDDASFAATMTTALAGKQPLDGELTALAALTSAADRLPYFTGSGAASLATFTAAARALLDDADAAAMLATLGAVPDGDTYRKGFVDNGAASAARLTVPGCAVDGASTTSYALDTDYYFPIWCEDATTFDRIYAEVTTAAAAANTCRVGIYQATTSWQPTGTLVEEFGTFLTDALAVLSLTPSGGQRVLPRGRYVLALTVSATASLRVLTGTPAGGPIVRDVLSNSPFVGALSVARASGAFPSSGTAWTAVTSSAVGFRWPLAMRVTAVG